MPGDENHELHQRRSTHNRESVHHHRQSTHQNHDHGQHAHHHDGHGHGHANHKSEDDRRSTAVSGVPQVTVKTTDDDKSSINSTPIEIYKRSTGPSPNAQQDKRDSGQSNASSDDHGRVHFIGAQAVQGEPNNLSPTSAPETKQENLARASWTTASFTEVPNALDELTQQHHPSRTSADRSGEAKKKVSEISNSKRSSAGDLHSILVKHGQLPMDSTLTKYLRPTMLDEGSQAGVPSWDWLSRLEQMLIHFFLMIFESSSDSTKLVMEMMPSEAGQQIEEIFQLLLKAEPDMYKELGHLVHLAEKWLIHWKGDSEEREKAVEYVRLYMKGVKDKNYYRLPIQVRLHNPTCVDKDVASAYPVYVNRPPVNQIRIASPRVKPGTHFSRVVANILCGRPCEDPFPLGDIYADNFGRKVFKKPLHGDREIRTYTDKKYGDFYTRKDIFSIRRGRKSLRNDPALAQQDDGGAGDADEPRRAEDRDDCIENLNCWVPMYTKAYVQNLTGNGCEVFAKADFKRDVKAKACKSETCANAAKKGKSKKLYEWVRGPDGKVHRRAVGSYTELGVTGSVDRLHSRERSPGKGGTKGTHSKKFNNKTFKGTGASGKGGKGVRVGYAGKAVSDSRFGHEASGSKGKDGISSKGKTKTDSDGRSKKYNNKGGVGVYNVVDVMSIDGSGDSAHEEMEARYKYGAGSERDKRRQDGDNFKDTQSTYSNRGRSVSRYDSTKGVGGRGRGGGGRGEGYGEVGGSGRGYRGGADGRGYGGGTDGKGFRGGAGGKGYGAAGVTSSSSRRDKEFVDLFSKNASYHNRRDTNGTHKTYKSHHGLKLGKLGKYLNDEYEGEGFSWNPSSEYFNFDKDDENRIDDPAIMTVNQCWERASKMFKKPNKALVIPPPENLSMYLEKKYPKSRWPRGTPVASRNYPNGSIFVSQYASGSSRVFYPHGGLALLISAPSPATSRVLVVRDPSDHIFFFDKALLADINSSGKGTIFGDDGVVKLQYSPIGGFKLDGLEKGQRWQWHRGGVRMIFKLNKYISLRISDQNKIFLNFYGNMRGFLVNVASGKEVILMNPDNKKKDPLMNELRQLVRPKTVEDKFDYIRGKFNVPATLGFVDKAKHYRDAVDNNDRSINGSHSARNLLNNGIDQYYTPTVRKTRNIFTARGPKDPITYPDDFADCTRMCGVVEEPIICCQPNGNTFQCQYCI
ncbi:unnamed protein product [Orchesella dallaii]|uniref:FAM194 C-terminal domain-containing protein n=1 Tax=Orchesella dallaii TaxID=48710 RepID=A0ABP1QBZ9_9HEXA